MENKRNAWIQIPDFSSYDIGEVSRSEIKRLWGARWAQKCIRDAAEEFDFNRLSPLPSPKDLDYCPPQLGFENGEATLALSPWVNVKPTIFYGEPIPDFTSWTVFVNVKRGSRLFGLIPVDFSFETIASEQEALELILLFFDHSPKEIPTLTRNWRVRLNEQYQYRTVGAFFL